MVEMPVVLDECCINEDRQNIRASSQDLLPSASDGADGVNLFFTFPS